MEAGLANRDKDSVKPKVEKFATSLSGTNKKVWVNLYPVKYEN
jgi:hypothetical protein